MAKEERVKAVMYKNNLLNPGTKLEEKDVMDILKGKPSSQVLSRPNLRETEKMKARNRRPRSNMDDTDEHSVRSHRKKMKNLDMISVVDTNEYTTTTYSAYNDKRNRLNTEATTLQSQTLADSREASREFSRKRAYNSGGSRKSRKRLKEHVLVNKGRDKGRKTYKTNDGEYIGHGENPYFKNHMKFNKYSNDIEQSFKYKSNLKDLV